MKRRRTTTTTKHEDKSINYH